MFQSSSELEGVIRGYGYRVGLVPCRCVSMVCGPWNSLPAGGFPAGRLEQLSQVGKGPGFCPCSGGG